MIYDVVIAGGGMVGAGLAGLLARAGMQVAVVEGMPAPGAPAPAQYDNRVSALTRASQRILDGLGAWQGPWLQRVQPYRRMRVWDQGSPGGLAFDCADIGEPDLGHIAENRVIQLGLEQALAGLPGVHWLRPRRVTGLELRADRVVTRLDDGELESRLLVGADGGQSQVRRFAGIGVDASPYGQTAVVAWVQAEQGHDETAWQRFLETGPLAFLPLPENNGCVVWSSSDAHAQVLRGMQVSSFDTALTEALEGRFGPIHCAGPRHGFELVSRQADRYVQARLALVGDAAHTIHPLAGQGVNMGLLDAASLAEVLVDAARRGDDLGALPVLRRYERWRRGHNQLMNWSMAGFKSLFGSTPAPLRGLRGLGMNLVDRAGPVKHALIRQAMGLAGDLPAAARAPAAAASEAP